MNYAVKENSDEEEVSGGEMRDVTSHAAPLTFDHTNEQRPRWNEVYNPFAPGSKKSTINSDINIVVNNSSRENGPDNEPQFMQVNPLHQEWLRSR